jgi:hypothetical protein
MPESSQAPILFPIMSVLFFARAVSDLYAPASDYVGGLGLRVKFLSLCAILQLPLIWLGSEVYQDVGAVIALVASYSLMIAGYVFIAKRVFFGYEDYHLPKDVPIAVIMILGALFASLFVTRSVTSTEIVLPSNLKAIFVTLDLYVVISLVLFISVPALKRVYLTLKLLDLK